jgi:hypothetical protein
MQITTGKLLVLTALCATLSGVVGAFAGYQAALRVPTITPLAVVDFDALAATIRPDDPASQQKAEELSMRIRAEAQRLADTGVVVLDRASIVAAPASFELVLDAPTQAAPTQAAPAPQPTPVPQPTAPR